MSPLRASANRPVVGGVPRRAVMLGGALALASCAGLPAGPGWGSVPWVWRAGSDWPPRPAVFAHRGASAWRPEHTLASYRKAIEDGADLIEPDLVITRDGVLVARHENAMAILGDDGRIEEATTNVADHPEFAQRLTTKRIDGRSVTGWFVEDFTLAEIDTLRARERIPTIRSANALDDDRYAIATLQQIVDLARDASQRLGRTIGVAPETKHPSYFRSIGLPLEPALLALLDRNGLNRADAPVVIQSFEVDNLRDLRQHTAVPLAQLVAPGGQPYDAVLRADGRTYADMITPAGLEQIRQYAQILAPHKSQVRAERDGSLGTPSDLVQRAHAAGLWVVPWTLRPENAFLPRTLKAEPVDRPSQRGHGAAEVAGYLDAGVDGLFTDDPATARAVIDRWRSLPAAP